MVIETWLRPQSEEARASGLYGLRRTRLVPVSCTGTDCGDGTVGVTPKQFAWMAIGRLGKLVSAAVKLNAEVRSPQTWRRQALRFGSGTPVHLSRKRTIEV